MNLRMTQPNFHKSDSDDRVISELYSVDKLLQRNLTCYTVANRGLEGRSCGNERNDSEAETER